MRTLCTFGVLVILAVAQPVLAERIVLSPIDDAQLDRTAYQQPYTFTNPPSNGLYMFHKLSTTGELHEGFLEYSLASLPSNATVTSAFLTCGVNLISNSGSTYPSLSLSLYDGGDGRVTYADLSKSLVNVAQSQSFNTTGTYIINFFSVLALNDRLADFPSGYVGLDLFPRVEGYQARLWSAEEASLYGVQAPTLTINYTTPEPTSLSLLGAASAMALVYWRVKRRQSS